MTAFGIVEVIGMSALVDVDRSRVVHVSPVRQLSGVLVLVAAVLAGVSPIATASVRASPVFAARRCEPGHMPRLQGQFGGKAHLIMADAIAEVYETEQTHPRGDTGDAFPTEVVGCAYGQSRLYDFLAGPPLVIAGSTVATANEAGGGRYDPDSKVTYSVSVVSLKTARVLHTLASPAGVESIVVKPDGAVAWIADIFYSPITHTPDPEQWVYAYDATGQRLLATGSDIDPQSLALARSILYWTQGGMPESAPLD